MNTLRATCEPLELDHTHKYNIRELMSVKQMAEAYPGLISEARHVNQ